MLAGFGEDGTAYGSGSIPGTVNAGASTGEVASNPFSEGISPCESAERGASSPEERRSSKVGERPISSRLRLVEAEASVVD